MQKDFASTTKGSTLHLYANSATGSDSNNGRTAATAKATFAAVMAEVPDNVEDMVIVHLSGTFTGEAEYTIDNYIPYNGKLYILGEDTYTAVYDNAGSPFVADISSTSSVGLSTLGMTANQYKGYWVEIVSGAAAGQTRSIITNTATTITPSYNWTVDPGACQFRVVRPSAMLSNITTRISVGGTGEFVMHHLTISGATGSFNIYQTASNIIFTDLIVDKSCWFEFLAALNLWRGSYTAAGTYTYRSQSTPLMGPCFIQDLDIVSCKRVNVDSFVGKNLRMYNSDLLMYQMFNVTSMKLLSCRGLNYWEDWGWGTATLGVKFYGWASGCKIAGGVIGLDIQDCDAIHIEDMDISDCTSHGIQAKRSKITMAGVTGTGNVGAGAYIHQSSVCQVKAASPITITGTVGELAVTDPTAEDSTWALVEGGTPVTVAAEMTLVKAG